MLPGSFLLRAERENQPGDEATETQTQLEVFGNIFAGTTEHVQNDHWHTCQLYSPLVAAVLLSTFFRTPTIKHNLASSAVFFIGSLTATFRNVCLRVVDMEPLCSEEKLRGLSIWH